MVILRVLEAFALAWAVYIVVGLAYCLLFDRDSLRPRRP